MVLSLALSLIFPHEVVLQSYCLPQWADLLCCSPRGATSLLCKEKTSGSSEHKTPVVTSGLAPCGFCPQLLVLEIFTLNSITEDSIHIHVEVIICSFKSIFYLVYPQGFSMQRRTDRRCVSSAAFLWFSHNEVFKHNLSLWRLLILPFPQFLLLKLTIQMLRNVNRAPRNSVPCLRCELSHPEGPFSRITDS